MPKMQQPNSPKRRKMVKAVRAEYLRLEKELRPHLAAMSPEMAKVNIAQNVLRDCLTAIIDELVPFEHGTAIELATRTASYSLSVLPMEDQDHAVSVFLGDFAEIHMQRTSQGQIIAADWKFHDGTTNSNFPRNG